MPESLSRFKQAAQSLAATRRPWSAFLDPASLNPPSSIPDATTRLAQNLAHFRANYALILLLILCLALLNHPLALIALLAVLLAWAFLCSSRAEEDAGAGGQRTAAAAVALFAATVAVLIWGGVWARVLVGGGIGVVLVALHGVLRSTDDLVSEGAEASPYVNLLSDDDLESPNVAL